ncbi:hypothetical protein BD309DRAFT_953032 [Dichomitus squalens]|uniref:Uncharacterized protein n=2 Tax=Dichomitus squalens TaxID=114155 RepID=A0A4Q9P309_9APHY|nr:uncharacterized protein DICSQDRAFT_89657 [Dichomitus squalens LYAD-421 SS1]EJF59169.1 hypothetical protein DICSQDRAFT_89657 [Dichomitus squalens LYAD-421 SS1]TBU46951.1 hypothetical protein BD309DRAFT_953032 [Dichomitus squalens]TBU56623.1 hypothetical protein BD310DRAFT_931040 [Dichomitus squalens]
MTSSTISLDASEHPVKSVTIFQSSTAELKRTFTIDLKAGSNVVKISNISSHVDRESPRIHGLGTDARVVDISCNTTLANAPSHKSSKNAIEIKKLTAKRKLLEGERTVRQRESELLDDGARSLVSDKETGLDVFMETWVSRKRSAMKAIVDLDDQIEALDQEIWQLNNIHKGETAGVVTATVLAKHERKVEVQLTYLVTGVTWQPYYDLHASTSDGKPSSDVTLHYCANIIQTTGEDWSNTSLTLSTANSHALRSLSVPRVDPLRFTFAGGRLLGSSGNNINTNVARGPFGQPVGGGGGLFGQPQQQQQSAFGQASLFGQGQQQLPQPVQTGFGAFGQAAVQPQSQGTSLTSFLAQKPAQPQPGSFLGQQPAQAVSTGLFGRVSSPAQGGLWGSAPANPQPVIVVPPSQANTAPGPFSVRPASAAPANADPEEEFEHVGGTPGSEEDEVGQGAVLDRSPLSLAYRVEGKVSLASDGIAHKVSIAVLDFSAVLKYVCVPRKTNAAFIEGRIKNTSEFELLAGPVSVFMDDSFVTKTLLGLIGVSESFVCVLGIDTSLKVAYNTKARTVYEPRRSFAEPSKTLTRTVVTTISNGHPFDIADLVVRDAVPIGSDEANIAVTLRKPEGLAQAKDGEDVAVKLSGETKGATVRWTKVESGAGGERDGLYEWLCGVKAGKKVQLEAEWDVKAPSSVRLEEQPNIRFGTAK